MAMIAWGTRSILACPFAPSRSENSIVYCIRVIHEELKIVPVALDAIRKGVPTIEMTVGVCPETFPAREPERVRDARWT